MRYEEFTIEGRNAVIEAFRSGKPIDKVFILDGCQDGPMVTIRREAKKKDVMIKYVTKERLDQMSETGKHQGVIAYAAAYEYAGGFDILEKAKEEKQAHGEIETYYPGFLLAQDTYYVGYIKGVGHIYQQTVIDTYSKIGFAKLYDRKNALVAADMLNDRVIPFFEQHDLKLMRMLTDRGTEYCGNRENHEYEL